MLEELRRGGTNAEIAVRLGVTLDAVKFHISNMLGKLELDSRHQLAAWRPEPRRRLFGLLAVPGTLEPIGRLLVWAGVAAAGTAAVAGVAVVLIVLSSLDGSEQQLALAPTATATPTPTATAGATPAPGSVAQDRAALVALYNATGGANWETRWSWLTDGPIGEWPGVTVDGDGRVTHLNLDNNQLSGPIPAELGGLTNLEWLNLDGNELTGPIPAELGRLTNLDSLILYDNLLIGPIPAELGVIRHPRVLGGLNLEWLNLSNNQLSGPIPAELGSLILLELLYLQDNELSGPIPAELGGLTNLRDLLLAGNQFSGCLDPRLEKIPRSDLAELGLPFCN